LEGKWQGTGEDSWEGRGKRQERGEKGREEKEEKGEGKLGRKRGQEGEGRERESRPSIWK